MKKKRENSCNALVFGVACCTFRELSAHPLDNHFPFINTLCGVLRGRYFTLLVQPKWVRVRCWGVGNPNASGWAKLVLHGFSLPGPTFWVGGCPCISQLIAIHTIRSLLELV